MSLVCFPGRCMVDDSAWHDLQTFGGTNKSLLGWRHRIVYGKLHVIMNVTIGPVALWCASQWCLRQKWAGIAGLIPVAGPLWTEVWWPGAMVGGLATSSILSAISANWGRVSVVEAEPNTILTEGGIGWRNNWRTNAPLGGESALPSSCCICRSSWEGLRSPSSSAVSNCCSLHCSEASIRLISTAFKRS